MTQYLQDIFYQQIALGQPMGLEVQNFDGNALTLIAPLDKNFNDKGTAFGGSLYSVAVLTGWGLLTLLLKEHNLTASVVIHESQIKYNKPVDTDIVSRCAFTSEQQSEQLIKIFKRKGVARIDLEVKILVNDIQAVLFNGRYVIKS